MTAGRLMLDGTRCYTENCSRHAGAIREATLTAKQAKDRTREENEFIARRQWHPTKNARPYDETSVTPLSTWQCPVAADHEWEMPKGKRLYRGDGCPFCSGHRASSTNNLTLRPDLAAELDEEAAGLTARELTIASNREVPWKCSKCGHKWNAAPKTRQLSGCPKCVIRTGGFILTFETSLAGKHPHLAKEFDEEKNGIFATQVSAADHKVYWWRCSKGHSYPAIVLNRARRNSGCSVCHNKRITNENSLATLHPKIANELDEVASGFLASEIAPGSGKQGFWICSQNFQHRWSSSIRSRTGLNQHKVKFGCPDCTKSHTSYIEERYREAFSSSLQPLPEELFNGRKLALPWRKNKSMSVDILGVYEGRVIAIEYDGYWYHRSQGDYDRDTDKTKALLEAGYFVVRIREGLLGDLPLASQKLLQVHFIYSSDPAKIAATTDSVLFWLDSIKGSPYGR